MLSRSPAGAAIHAKACLAWAGPRCWRARFGRGPRPRDRGRLANDRNQKRNHNRVGADLGAADVVLKRPSSLSQAIRVAPIVRHCRNSDVIAQDLDCGAGRSAPLQIDEMVRSDLARTCCDGDRRWTRRRSSGIDSRCYTGNRRRHIRPPRYLPRKYDRAPPVLHLLIDAGDLTDL
jgi:hypothetical protein